MRLRVALTGLVLVAGACTDSPATTTAVTSATIGAQMTTSVTTAPPSVPEGSATLPLPPLAEVRIDVELIAGGFTQPTFATSRPGDDRLFVADQPGVVYAFDLTDGSRLVVLDIEDRVRFSGEQGLLGIAFHPDDPDRLIVHYSGNDGSTRVEQYRLDPQTGVADADGSVILIHAQPAANHNGGMIEFGPDGYLYLALGDGGGVNDQFDNGQDPFTLLGTILRIDLDGGDPYAIPPTNPFADGADGAPEVWAWGLRNPWRFSFDGSDLWVGDVGQAAWEEIDLLVASRPGDNAGWPLLEGAHCFRFSNCEPDLYLGPVIEYAHSVGRCSVTGGFVYRGASIPELLGTYLYGDYCTGEIWGLRLGEFADHALLTDPDDIFLPPLKGLTSFGRGPDGEVYVLQAVGLVWRLVPA